MRIPRFRARAALAAIAVASLVPIVAVAPAVAGPVAGASDNTTPRARVQPAERTAGTLAAWGLDGEYGAANVPRTGMDEVVAVDAKGLSAAVLRADGTAAAWTEGYSDFDYAGWAGELSDVVDIAMGGAHVVALLADGTVTAYGWDAHGQDTPPVGLTDVVAVDAGGAHNVALRADGTVAAWGEDDEGQGTVPDGLDDVVLVEAGDDHNLALRADGTVVAWGSDRYGKATPPAGLADVVDIAAGDEHSVALRADGTVVAWGKREYTGVPAGLTDVVDVAADHQTVALHADGTVTVWGSPWSEQWGGATTAPLGLEGVHAVSTGSEYNFVIVEAGGVLPDTTAPEIVTKGDITKAATSSKGARIWFAPTAFDAVFGELDAYCGWYRGEWYPLGTTEVWCDATDWAGNRADAPSYEVRVTWSWSGLMAPFETDGVSSFDHGERVPVHFKLTKGSHGASDARASLAWAPVVDGTVGQYVPVTDAGSGAERFSWDGWKYVLEWDTAVTPGPGTYSLKVDLGDGVERTSLVELG